MTTVLRQQSMKYPPPHVEPNRDGYIVRAIEEWCLSHGLAIRPPLTAGLSSDSSIANRLAIPAPVTVFPSLFPTLCFEQAKSIQKLYNELYARIASDEVWLGNIVKG